jgi:replicative DNA helicase
MKLNDMPQSNDAIHAEQSLLGALILDNDALDRVADVKPEHFYNAEHRLIFSEICKQAGAGKTVDPLTLFEQLQGKMENCLPYLNSLVSSVGSSAGASRYADIVIDKAIKRSIVALGGQMQEMRSSLEPSDVLVDRLATKVEELARKKTKQDPMLLSDMLGNYVDVIQDRLDGKIKPIATGFKDLDERLCGGLERGTLTIVAARPSMGKTAFALALGRNVAETGSALFLSMEMARDQVNDRNIAALGRLPVSWLRNPKEKDREQWDRLSGAFARAKDLNLYIDDQTGLNMLEIRNKSRMVKRKAGLDMLIIDQLSFITGGSIEKQGWEVVGEYTRGLLALAKELNVAVVLLCQLNRKLEERNDKRPIMSDLALSGSIEQDAANILFLYRDEIYRPDSPDKGICEVITKKQRQGEPGMVGLQYIGAETRFEDMNRPWQPAAQQEKPRSRGFE